MAPVAESIFELGAERGFAGLRTDYETRSVTLRWKGPVPADVKRLAARLNVTLKVMGGAAYSRLELEEGRDAVLNAPIARRLGIVTTDLNDDASGFQIGMSGATAPSKRDMAELRRISGVSKITARVAVEMPKGYATRSNDSSPWKGGARIETIGGGCSSGFAVLVGSSGRLLSARHCDTSGNGSIKDGGGTTIASGGSSVAVIGRIDSMLIDPSASPATTPRIYRSTYSSSSTSAVKNWYSNWPGDPVCTSGASTGEHCGTVYDDGDTVSLNGYNINVIQVRAPSGSIMGGQGDSGGAMFKKVTGGVQARGILLGPDTDYSQTTSCGTVDPEVGTIYCSRYINYVPISTILNTWGVRLETG